MATFLVACVASVSVEFGSKERPRNGVFGILPARKMGREPKKERWGYVHSSPCNSLLPNCTETLATQATFLANEINATDRDVTGPPEQVQSINNGGYLKPFFLGRR